MAARVAEIEKQRRRRIVKHRNAPVLGDVCDATILIELVEPVRQPARLANINLITAIAVDIAHRDSVVAVDVNSAGRIQAPAPVWHAAQHLLSERFRIPEQFGGDVAEERPRRSDERLFERLESRKAAVTPGLLPEPDPVMQQAAGRARDFVAHPALREYEKPGAANVTELCDPLFETRQKVQIGAVEFGGEYAVRDGLV